MRNIEISSVIIVGREWTVNRMDDLISRQAAIDAVESVDWYHQNKNGEMVHGANDDVHQAWYKAEDIYKAIKSVPSAQPGQRNAKVFRGIIVEYPSISAYPEYEGKPYFSIKYTENGQEFIGYGTYKPEVLSEYLKEYFMPLTQPWWIPCSTALPEYDGEYLVTKKSFGWNCKEYIETDIARYEKKDGWHKADQVLAWQLLPTPYREGGQDGKN